MGVRPVALRLQLALAALGLCMLVFAAYGSSIDNGFVWDDHEQIVMNPYMKAGAPLAPLFTGDVRFTRQASSVQTKAYRPLQMLTYRFATEWLGGSASVFHTISVSVAALGAVAALVMFWLLTGRIGLSLAAAALFAVHPVHTEVVDWIAALPDLGVGLTIMMAFALWLAANRPSTQPRLQWTLQGLSVLSFFIALLWKETAVVFPLLLFGYALIGRGREGRSAIRAARQSAPYWVMLGGYLWLRYEVLGPLTAGARDWALTIVQYMLTDMQLFLAYCAKLLLPVNLNAYVMLHPVRSVMSFTATATVIGVLAVIAGLIYLVRRAPLAGFAMFWVCVSLLPALNLTGLGRNAFAERYLYVASAGYCLLLVLVDQWLVARLPVRYRRLTASVMLISVLGCFTAETIARGAVWKDDTILFGETLKVSPDAPFVRVMVASDQSADATQSAAAEKNYLEAVALAKAETPFDRLDLVTAYEGLASLYAGVGDTHRALQVLTEAQQFAPETSDMASEEGIILAQAGRGVEAEPLLHRALAIQHDNENILSALGLVARQVHHDLNGAAVLFEQALAAHPQLDDFNAAQHSNLATVYADEDNIPAAIAEMRKAVAIAPRDPEYHDNLASALAAAGRFEDARAEAQIALQLAPNDANARDILQRLAQN